MKKAAIRVFAALISIFIGWVIYSDLNSPTHSYEQITVILLGIYFTIAMLNHAIYKHRKKYGTRSSDTGNQINELVRKIAVLILIGLTVFIGACSVYLYLTGRKEVLSETGIIIICVIFLHYAITGNRRPFFPKSALYLKENDD